MRALFSIRKNRFWTILFFFVFNYLFDLTSVSCRTTSVWISVHLSHRWLKVDFRWLLPKRFSAIWFNLLLLRHTRVILEVFFSIKTWSRLFNLHFFIHFQVLQIQNYLFFKYFCSFILQIVIMCKLKSNKFWVLSFKNTDDLCFIAEFYRNPEDFSWFMFIKLVIRHLNFFDLRNHVFIHHAFIDNWAVLH